MPSSLNSPENPFRQQTYARARRILLWLIFLVASVVFSLYGFRVLKHLAEGTGIWPALFAWSELREEAIQRWCENNLRDPAARVTKVSEPEVINGQIRVTALIKAELWYGEYESPYTFIFDGAKIVHVIPPVYK